MVFTFISYTSQKGNGLFKVEITVMYCGVYNINRNEIYATVVQIPGGMEVYCCQAA